VQAICDRVGILRGGVLQAVQTVESLTGSDFRNIRVRFAENTAADAARAAIAGLPGVSELTHEGAVLALQFSGPTFDPLLAALAGRGVVGLDSEKPTLEEIFLKFYDRKGGQS
jgi:ABC-2 type transport system ATP-binding protein